MRLDILAAISGFMIAFQARANGAGVLLISADLDELFALSDRLTVIYSGSIVAEMSPSSTTPEKLGLAMTGAKSA